VYLLAADVLLSKAHPGVRTESAEYRFVTGGAGAKPVRFEASDLVTRMEDLQTAVSSMVHGMSSGMFFPYPDDARACKYCDYAAACGKVTLSLARMKYGDRRARFFVQTLAGIE
jgi:hypothetical protein